MAQDDKEATKVKNAREVLWHISGADYDLTNFVAKHPGGSISIQLGLGIDCTRLFMSYHPPGSIAHKILETYRVSTAEPEPLPKSEFHQALCDMVKKHFEGKGKGAHKASYSHLAFLALSMIAMYVSWWAWFCGYWFSLVTWPLASWLVFTNGVHDASHFALSSKAWVNHAMCFTALPLLVNPLTWYSQHVVEHHSHTNEMDHDVDLCHLLPFRLHKLDTRRGGMENLAKTVLTGIHLGIGVPLNALTGAMEQLPGEGFPEGAGIKLLHCFRENTWHYVSMWSALLGAVIFLTFPPFYQETILKKICFWLVPYVLTSLLFMVFTQVSHIQEACQTDRVLDTTDFFKRQALTSLDYSMDSKFWSLLSGGLNMQSLHHSIPWVSSCHYHELYPKFRKVCTEHGALPPTIEDFPSALLAFYSYVKKLNVHS